MSEKCFLQLEQFWVVTSPRVFLWEGVAAIEVVGKEYVKEINAQNGKYGYDIIQKNGWMLDGEEACEYASLQQIKGCGEEKSAADIEQKAGDSVAKWNNLRRGECGWKRNYLKLTCITNMLFTIETRDLVRLG